MSNKLIHKLDEVLHEIEMLDSQLRQEYINALDIEDTDLAESVETSTFEKIRSTKEWKRQIESLKITILSLTSKNVYANKEPISMTLFGEKVPIKFWNEVLVNVCEAVQLRKPYLVAKFDKSDELNSCDRVNFSYTESDIKFNGKMLSNGLWIETNRSANNIVAFSGKILELCGYSTDDLILEYK